MGQMCTHASGRPTQLIRFVDSWLFGVICQGMKRSIIFLLGCATIFVRANIVHAMGKGPNDAIVGIWRGEYENLPAVTLNITDEAGPLQ